MMKVLNVLLAVAYLKSKQLSGRAVNSAVRRHWRSHKFFSSSPEVPINYDRNSPTSGDILLSGLNEAQDISVRVVSCREIVQEAMIKTHMTPVTSKALGEVLTCCLMMGSGLKNQESIQVNLVGTEGMRNIMGITDSELKVRGMVGVPEYTIRGNTTLAVLTATDLLGYNGQVQVVRNHPSYKRPTNGITELRPLSIPLNLGFYLAESEQRAAAMITDVRVDGQLCRHALGVLVETLPGADSANIEKSISNLKAVESKGLSTYLKRTTEEEKMHTGMFRDFESCVQRILDDCLLDMGTKFQWSKMPSYACNCDVNRVWRALRLLPKDDIVNLIETQNTVEVRVHILSFHHLQHVFRRQLKCEFCGTEYKVQKEEIERELLNIYH